MEISIWQSLCAAVPTVHFTIGPYANRLCSKIDTSLCMICFLDPGESSEVSGLEESRALREQLSSSQMDRDQPRVKQASLTDRVRVTKGSHAVSGHGQAA